MRRSGGSADDIDVPDPWFDAEMTHLVVIEPEIVAGVRLLAVP